MRTKPSVAGLLALLVVPSLSAHGSGYPIVGRPWWTLWNLDALILANLVLLAGFYTVGWRERRASQGASSSLHRRQALAFASGIAALVVALISPVDVLASELLSVHMVQHMVLMNLAAPLFVLGAPVRTLVWFFSPAAQRKLGRGLRAWHEHAVSRYLLWQPILLWLLYAGVLWIWHLPRFYEAALQHEWIHDAQHLMFFAAACLFWRVMFDPIGRLRLGRGLAVVYLFTTSLHATLLGVFMAVAPRLWYPTYADRTEAWGLAALEDQQLAGYIMWMPACMMYAVVAALVFARWLGEEPPRPAQPVPS